MHAAGASRVRVRLAPVGTGAVSVELADSSGLPVLSVRELVTRPVSATQLSAAAARRGWRRAVGGGVVAGVRWRTTASATARGVGAARRNGPGVVGSVLRRHP